MSSLDTSTQCIRKNHKNAFLMPLKENTDITCSCIFPVQFHRNFELNVSFIFGFNYVLHMEIFFQGKFYYFVHKNVNTN